MPARFHTSPTPRSRLVGRQAELAALTAWLEGGVRLLTVLGPPGVGKSRLVLELAQIFRDRSGAGAVVHVELAATSSAEGLWARAAVAFGASTSGARSPADALAEALAGVRPALVVLDDAEAVAEVLASALPAWLDASPPTHFVITSRARLKAHGEVLFDLAPLALPGEDAVGDAESVRLFLERARQVGRVIDLDAGTAPLVARIVRHLDGLPLGIELAAARLRALGLAELDRALGAGLALVDPARDTRHRGLDAALDASYRLLDAHERAALGQCGVFQGGFDLAAAEAVVDLGEGPAVPEVPAILEALLDESLLTARGEAGGGLRFGLYATVRAFGWDHLELDARRSCLARHADHYLAEAERRAEGAAGPEGEAVRAWLADEQDNLVAIHGRALADGGPGLGPEVALRAALALEPLLFARAPASLAGLLDQALEAADRSGACEALRARARIARSHARRVLGRLAAAVEDLEVARAMAEALGDRLLLGQSHTGLAIACRRRGDLAGAAQHLMLALAHARATGHRRGEATTAGNLGSVELDRGRLPEARAHSEAARVLACTIGDRGSELLTMANLAAIDAEEGRGDDARARLEAALRVAREEDLPHVEAALAAAQALVELEHGSGAAVGTSLARAREAVRARGNRVDEARLAAYAALWHASAGDLVAARECLVESGRLAASLDEPRVALVRRVVDEVVSLAAARQGATSLQGLRASRARAEEARASLVARGEGSADVPWIERSYEARLLARLLARALSPFDAAGPPGSTVEIASTGEWFRLAGGAAVHLETRGPLVRLLARLASERRAAPDRSLPVDALFDAAWPGERRIRTESRQSRVYVAISTLRKLGLREVLVRRADGYRLDPAGCVVTDELAD